MIGRSTSWNKYTLFLISGLRVFNTQHCLFIFTGHRDQMNALAAWRRLQCLFSLLVFISSKLMTQNSPWGVLSWTQLLQYFQKYSQVRCECYWNAAISFIAIYQHVEISDRTLLCQTQNQRWTPPRILFNLRESIEYSQKHVLQKLSRALKTTTVPL